MKSALKKIKKSRGGARVGAGRPSESSELKSERLVVRVSPELKQRFREKGGSRWLRTTLSERISHSLVENEEESSFVVPGAFAGVPMFDYTVQAGFSESVEAETQERIDFNDLLVRDQGNTCVLRVSGHSMIDAGIDDGDLIVVDRARMARHGDVVVMQINNEFTIKRFIKEGKNMYLKTENHSGRYSNIYPEEDSEWKLFGVVNFTIKPMSGRIM